jgi:phytoene desaturase
VSKKAVILGAGIAGLAAAVRLRKAGFDVDVFEQADGPGGKLREKWIGAYRFDLGPSLFTLPRNVEELFELNGLNPSDYFRYQKLEHVCHYFFEDGTRFQVPSNTTDYINQLCETFGEDKRTVEKFLQNSEEVYNITTPVFLKSELSFNALLKKKETFQAIIQLYKLPISGTLFQKLQKTFKNPKTVQLFSRYATYNGSNPYSTPAMMMLIPHLENGIGAFLPEKGMFDISRSIHQLGERLGVRYHFNQKVESIIVEKNTVKGISLGDKKMEAQIVLSNIDITPTYRKLLGDKFSPEKILNQEKSSSALIFYWGVKGVFPELDVHNIFFSEDYKSEFDYIFNKKMLHDDPTVYINITSKVCKNDAPENCENWFVMINVPHLNGQDWMQLKYAAKQAILAKLQRILGKDISSLIEQEEVLDPQLIQDRTGSHLGSLYGNASNSTFSAFMRHQNHSNKLKGLYFCGGSVHPGGGVPLCLFSARLAAERIIQDSL